MNNLATKNGMNNTLLATPLLFLMFDKQGAIHHCIEAHVSQLAQQHGEPLPIEDDDDLSIYEDAQYEMIPLDDDLLAG